MMGRVGENIISNPFAGWVRAASEAGWLAGAVLLVYVLFLCGGDFLFSPLSHFGSPSPEMPPVQLRELVQPFHWFGRLMIQGILGVMEFAVLGILVVLAVRNRAAGTSWTQKDRPCEVNGALPVIGFFYRDSKPIDAPGWKNAACRAREGVLAFCRQYETLLWGIGLTFLVRAVQTGGTFRATAFILPLVGTFLGMGIGIRYRAGTHSPRQLATRLMWGLVVLSGMMAVIFYLATESKPFAFVPPQVTPTEKSQLAEALKGSESLEDGRQRLGLSEHDVNLLLATGFAHLPLEGKANVHFGRGTFDVKASVRTPWRPPFERYVNVHAICHLEIDKGKIHCWPDSVRLGRLPMPGWIAGPMVQVALALILDDPQLVNTMASLDSLRLTPSRLEGVYRAGAFREELVSTARNYLGEPPDILRATEAHFQHLVNTEEALPEGDPGFVAFMQTAFKLARARSHGGDAVLENRAAILALAIRLGHFRIKDGVGTFSNPELNKAAWTQKRHITLRGRHDWARHFFVSAGLAILSNKATSDGAGLLKEEIDAGEGGSGFSFADLLADRAGTEFALAATRDTKAARQIQNLLQKDFRIAEVFPPASDLPEGISDAELQSRYGGVDGPGYKQLLGEIERRLTTCPVLLQ